MFQEFLKEVKPIIDDYLRDFLEEQLYPTDIPRLKPILEYLYDFATRGGKRGRSALMILGYMGVRGEYDEKIIKASIGLELLHDYLLVHDDIMDRDEMRRNAPTLWKALEMHFERILDGGDAYHMGISTAIAAGDVAEALATIAFFDALDTETAAKLAYHYHRVLQNTGYGQLLDLLLAKIPLDKVRIEDVLKVHELKTARYTVEGPLIGGAIVAGAKKDVMDAYAKFSIPTGIAFQIQDDILGIVGEESVIGKPVGSDLMEGKRTPLVVYAYKNGDKRQREILLRVLGNRQASPEDIEAAKDVIIETGALDYSKNLARELAEKGKEAIREAPVHEKARKILEDFAEWVIERVK